MYWKKSGSWHCLWTNSIRVSKPRGISVVVTKSVLVYMFKIAKHTIAAASYKHLSYTSVINYGNVTLPDFVILFYSSLTWRKR